MKPEEYFDQIYADKEKIIRLVQYSLPGVSLGQVEEALLETCMYLVVQNKNGGWLF